MNDVLRPCKNASGGEFRFIFAILWKSLFQNSQRKNKKALVILILARRKTVSQFRKFVSCEFTNHTFLFLAVKFFLVEELILTITASVPFASRKVAENFPFSSSYFRRFYWSSSVQALPLGGGGRDAKR